MINNSEFTIFDGDMEIVYSNTFNVYNNELKIGRIGGFDLIFKFQKDLDKNESTVVSEASNENKVININLTNFGSTLGTGTTNKISLMTIGDENKKEIFYSLYGASLDESSSLLQVTLTIYAK